MKSTLKRAVMRTRAVFPAVNGRSNNPSGKADESASTTDFLVRKTRSSTFVSQKKSHQPAQKSESFWLLMAKRCFSFCAFCALLWSFFFLCNLCNLWMF